MPNQKYSLETGGQKRLEISWIGLYKEMEITLDDAMVGVIADKKALADGQEFSLSDGSLLKVKLVSSMAGSEMQVTRNGIPLPESSSSPQSRVGGAVGVVFLVAGLNLLLGFLALIIGPSSFTQLGISLYNLVFGAFFLIMGFLINRFNSKTALILSIVVLSLDAISGIILNPAGYTPSIIGLIVRVFLIIQMVKGVGTLSALKRPTVPPAVPPAL